MNNYWQKRREDLLRQMEKDEQKLLDKLDKLYSGQIAELERDIAAYYQKYGKDNVIEYRNLLNSISEKDREMLMQRMDEFAAKYPQYAHLMPVRESIYRLNELEAIQMEMYIQQYEIGAIEQEELQAHFEEYALKSANLAAEQMGFGDQFYSLNSSLISSTVGAAWSQGKNYSERIWENREKLAQYLNDDFAKLIARGVSYDKCVADLAKRFGDVSRRDIKRLVFTEGTFLFNETQAQVHENEFDKYCIACADSRACPICKSLQANQRVNPVNFEDRTPGINFPPLHPWCRCSYTVQVDDWDAWIDDYVARHGGDRLTPSYFSYSIPDDIRDRYTLSNFSDVVFGTRIGGKCDIDIDSLRAVMESIEYVKNEFPELKNSIKSVYLRTEAAFIDRNDWNKTALAGVHRKYHDTILLGDYFLKSNEELKRCIKDRYDKGWFSTDSIEGVIAHECGHIACHTISDNHPDIWFGGDKVAQDAVSIAFRKWKKENKTLFDIGVFDESMTEEDFMGLISGYAKESYEEAVAESFAFEIMDEIGEGASPSAFIFAEIREMLRS
jgi:SPP1 gp7 family putative phage head morphogenesis protein